MSTLIILVSLKKVLPVATANAINHGRPDNGRLKIEGWKEYSRDVGFCRGSYEDNESAFRSGGGC